MKKISILGIALISLLNLYCDKSEENISQNIQNTCLPSNLQTGVVAFYPFSNGSINDFSGNNYHLTNPTSASSGQDRAGNSNCAFNFNATNNEFLTYVNPTFLDNFQTQPFSISLWYKPIGNNWSYEILFGRKSINTCVVPYEFEDLSLALHDCRKSVFSINEYSIWDNYDNNNNCNQTIIDLSNNWQHLVVSFDGNNILKLYRNGVLTTSLINTSTPCNSISFGDLFLGKDYTGLLDDVVIYNRILNQTEVNQLYNLQACCQ